jgi:hypothetical protein
MMVQRAVEIRNQPFQASLLPLSPVSNTAVYSPSESDRAREERCVEPYRSDPTFGVSSLKPG